MTMSRIKLAAIQMTSVADVAVNLKEARIHLETASRQGAKLAVLPENFAFMAADESARSRIAEPDGSGPIQDFLARAARECGLWIVGGTIPLASGESERPFAACCVWDDRGRRVGRYDKIHLFDVRVPDSAEAYRESRRTMPGIGAADAGHAVRPARDCRLLRPALSGAVSRDAGSRGQRHRAARRVHAAHRPGALAHAAAGRAPSRTCATWSPPRRPASIPADGAPTATP